MKIWLTRHGQTNLNKAHLMQGRTDEPLNASGILQAETMRKILEKDNPGLVFDAVYSSPLERAKKTASIIGAVPVSELIVDERLIETDFGKYEKRNYALMGPVMTLFWLCPEVFPAPSTVETIPSMIRRSHGFLQELEQKEYRNVLIACHGGIMRVLSGYLADAPKGFKWRPKPHNCEVRVWEAEGGKHTWVKKYML